MDFSDRSRFEQTRPELQHVEPQTLLASQQPPLKQTRPPQQQAGVGPGHPTQLAGQQRPFEQALPPVHGGLQGVVVVVLLEVELLVEVVPLTHADAVANDAADRHPGPHAWPAGQHVREAPLPQGVVPAGHPQRPRLASTQAMPLWQQLVPQGVTPLGQQHDDAGSVQVPPFGQQPCPQTGLPAGQVTAPPWNGRRTTAPAAARAVAPSSLSAPRREVGPAIARERSSKRSLTQPRLSVHGLAEVSHTPGCRGVDALSAQVGRVDHAVDDLQGAADGLDSELCASM